MKLSVAEEREAICQVKVEGQITHKQVSPLTDPLGNLLGPTAYNKVVLLDMTATDFLDSSGIGWLLSCHKRFRSAGGKLILHSIPPLVENVIRVLKLDSVFQLAPNLQSALDRSELSA